MDIVEKVTITYVPLEDRLRFSVQTKNSESYVLWVTARLAVAVVSAIVKTLDGVLALPQRSEQKSVQQWEQFSAVQKMQVTPAVKVCSVCEDLVQTIDVSVRGGNFSLIFHGVNHTSAKLPMTSTQMRQWLQIIYDQFLKANWPMTVWPSWLDRQKSTDRLLQSTVLH